MSLGDFLRAAVGISKQSPITVENSWNWPLEYRERSSERNLLTSCDLDSASGLLQEFFGRRKINLPVAERE